VLGGLKLAPGCEALAAMAEAVADQALLHSRRRQDHAALLAVVSSSLEGTRGFITVTSLGDPRCHPNSCTRND
jgi:hypothetical protein